MLFAQIVHLWYNNAERDVGTFSCEMQDDVSPYSFAVAIFGIGFHHLPSESFIRGRSMSIHICLEQGDKFGTTMVFPFSNSGHTSAIETEKRVGKRILWYPRLVVIGILVIILKVHLMHKTFILTPARSQYERCKCKQDQPTRKVYRIHNSSRYLGIGQILSSQISSNLSIGRRMEWNDSAIS